ncbi:MAG TPA: hypothetical protein PLL71_04175 [Agriterribacter sp.]|nr:hypothetical protein [Agriterribacter sp.]HRQ51564.1 hypothetical protein [Agriterribacter sp.]
MKRRLPEHMIEGTAFVIDVDKRELRQSDNPANVIRFEDMDYTGSSYRLKYDLDRKNLPYGLNSSPVKEIIVPELVTLDPEGMAARYRLPVSVIKQKNDFEVMVNAELLAKRMNGMLPVVSVAGHDFFVDYRLGELRASDDFNTSIRLHELDYFIEDELYRGFYHVPSRCMLEVNPVTIKEIPEGLVMLEIPIDRKLDPVAFAREEKLDIKATVIKYPPEEKTVLRTIPAEQTNLSRLVRTNQKPRQQHETEKLRPVKKMRRGHRL